MKKFLVILSAIAFVACNNDATTTEEKADSLKSNIDSLAGEKKDSIDAAADSLKNKVDSMAKDTTKP